MKFGTNEGTIDRVVRIVLGFALAGLAISGNVAAPWVYLVWVVAAVLLVTGAIGFCALYAIFRVNTRSAAH